MKSEALPRPSWRDQAHEVEWQNGWSRLRRGLTHSRVRSGSKWHQSPCPTHLSQHQSPFPSPPQSHPADEQLHCSMENFHLWPRSQGIWEQDTVMQCLPAGWGRNWGSMFSSRWTKSGGDELNLHTDLTLFLAEGMAPKWSSTPSLPAWTAHPTKSPQHSHALTGGPSLKFQLHHPMVDPALDPKKGPGRERPDPMKYLCWWIVMRCPSLATPIPTCGERLRPVGGPAWEYKLCKRDTMTLQLNILHYGKLQPSDCQWHNRKPQGGGMPHLPSMALPPRTSYFPLLPLTPRNSGSWGR